jgi:hypothetical protein
VAIVGLILLVLAGGGAGGYYWYQNRPGTVEITTVPSDSAILVDNVKVADKSPYRLERPPGPVSVSVVKAGYGRNDQNLVVRAGQSGALSIALEPAADTGFELTSVPPGGLVWLDGNPMSGPDGQARTDFRAYKIPPGKHVLEIKGDPKLQPWREEVLIEPGTIRKVKATLAMLGEAPKPSANPPPSAPSAAPSGDVLKTDSGAKPSLPGTSSPVPTGGAPVAVTHRRLRSREPRAYDDGTTPTPAVTRPSSRGDDDSAGGEGDCTITVGTRPWSEIWIDGKNTGRHTPYSESIACGKHKLSFRRPDLNLTRNENVVIRPGEKFKQSYPMEEE